MTCAINLKKKTLNKNKPTKDMKKKSYSINPKEDMKRRKREAE